MDSLAYTAWEILDRLHQRIEDVASDLSPEAFNWRPAANTNSIYALIAHTAGAERFWIAHVVGGQDVERDRESEFLMEGDDIAVPLALLYDAARRSHAVLASLSVDDWETEREVDGETFTVAWCILHVIEHAAEHLGHISLTRQVWEAGRSK
ncbi:MAG TPA: DUF664 domain-containing protein [Anaerolineae bacterium]|nr:DUF664 domain-containing protein [Anaerolineae bacterium]